MKIQLAHNFEEIISLENLLAAWQEFICGKRNKKDVQEFSFRLTDNIISLHNDLFNHTYNHGAYQAFNISDPKPRNIHKASVRDRLLHHAIYRILNPFFNKTFISDSYSCRLNKGTHRAVNRFRALAYKTNKNNTQTCWILKCDIRRFFANINHKILKNILAEYIGDKNILWLLSQVIDSFISFNRQSIQNLSLRGSARRLAGQRRSNLISCADIMRLPRSPEASGSLAMTIQRFSDSSMDYSKIGLPLGNLTSQLFVNIYMNKFDQFAKHKLKARYYIRYSDDFVIFSENKRWLENQVKLIQRYLNNELKLELHPDKVFIKTLHSGVDFLGWVNFFDHRVLRTSTKRRIFRRLKDEPASETTASYLGLLSHGNAYRIKARIRAF